MTVVQLRNSMPAANSKQSTAQVATERTAWQLELEDHQPLAIARQQVIEYLAGVASRRVPDCNPRCSRVILWRGQVLPLLGVGRSSQNHHLHVLVIGYVCSTADSGTRRIALALQQPPEAITVNDGDQCAPAPAQTDFWQGAIAACFARNG